MSNVLITASNLEITANHKLLLKEVNLSILEKDRIGIIGLNGSGKTSLVKVLAGINSPTKGNVTISSRVEYIAQFDQEMLNSKLTLLEYISQKVEDWWVVTSFLEQNFNFSGININQKIKDLSGGELMKVNFAIAFAKSPQMVFLDEPTNHIDLTSYKQLIRLISEFSGAIVIISHDPNFLDKTVNSIWELKDKKIRIFGGNYSYYKDQVEIEKQARLRNLEVAKKNLKKVELSSKIENIRASRSKSAQKTQKGSTSKSAQSFFKNRSEKVAGKNKRKLDEQIENAHNNLIQQKIKQIKKTKLTLDTRLVSSKRKIIDATDIKLTLKDEKCLINKGGIDISYGERIAILGDNGTGKTLLVKALMGEPSKQVEFSAKLYVASDLKIVYLSQKYEIIEGELNLIANIQKMNPGMPIESIRKQLANFLFLTQDDISKKAKLLSGGETARLAFAMITSTPLDLLILDEPTNNLDLETIDSITNSLIDFEGAITVISHNTHFLEKIDVSKYYQILNKKLVKLG